MGLSAVRPEAAVCSPEVIANIEAACGPATAVAPLAEARWWEPLGCLWYLKFPAVVAGVAHSRSFRM